MQKKNFGLSVVIPTIGRGEILEATLRQAVSVLDKFDFPKEIIVVNDGSKEIVFPEEVARRSYVRLVKNPEKGTGAARNLGAKEASLPILLFLDDDILMTEEAVNFVREMYQKGFRGGLNTNWIYPKEMLEKIRKTPLGRFKMSVNLHQYKGWVPYLAWSSPEKIIEIEDFASFFFSFPRETFWELGGFMNLAVMADVEFSKKILNKGIKLLLNKEVFVYHNEKDRQNIYHWYNRLLQGSRDRKILYEKTREKKYAPPRYSFLKRNILKILSANRKLLLRILDKWNKGTSYDYLYFKLAHLMTALAVYEGFFTDKKSTYGEN